MTPEELLTKIADSIEHLVGNSESVSYKSLDGYSLKGRLYFPQKPKKNKKSPVVVVVHGGSWKGRSGDMSSICRHLAASGFYALNVSYRFAPEYHFPTQLFDVEAAFRWMKAKSRKYKFDLQRVAVWGYSAGAHLAFLAAHSPLVKTRAVVVGAMPADFLAYPDAPILKRLLGASYLENPALWKSASPFYRIGPQTPPIFLYHGSLDKIVEVKQSEAVFKKLKKMKIKAEFLRLPWQGHISSYFSKKALSEALSFLKKTI
jgi:acetyl esterase/lipase